MGINLGAFIAGIAAGSITEAWGFRMAFLASGLIMGAGFLVYVIG
jgi:dipeptide/tripeptide permease